MTDSQSDTATVPDYESIMLPMLKLAGDKQEHATRDARSQLADEFGLAPQQIKEPLPNSPQTKWVNRVNWASTYLRKAGLLQEGKRGVVQITEQGSAVLQNPLEKIDIAFLNQFESFRAWRAKKNKKKQPDVKPDEEVTAQQTPEELMDSAYQELRQEVAQDILERITSAPPDFFEKLVVELLVSMGYGGSEEDAGEALGASGDGGVDGLIKQDRLGLDVLYVQAKRWEKNVGEPEIRDFVGALVGKAASKGVFLTTSDSTASARAYAEKIPQNVVLLDGEKIADYMIECDLGVTPISKYELKRVDTDYFDEA